jgi:hypothetical protein
MQSMWYGVLLYGFTPPVTCFCEGALREPSEEEYIEIINRRIDINYPTCSC